MKASIIIGIVIPVCSCSFLVDITSELFTDSVGHIIAAYGDFNADKRTDIFVISDDGLSVGVYLQSEDDGFQYKKLISVNKSTEVITSVMPGDFDNDVQMDLLLTLRAKDNIDSGGVTVRVWGQDKKGMTEFKQFPDTLLDQPLIFDWNAQMIPDLLGEPEKGKRVIYQFNTKEKKFDGKVWEEGMTPLKFPHSNAFLDLNGDFLADLSITVQKGTGEEKVLEFEQWYSEEGRFNHDHDITVEDLKKVAIVGQSSFLDFKRDGSTAMLLPVCEDPDCEKSAIWAYQQDTDAKRGGKWSNLDVSFKHGDHVYRFVPEGTNKAAALGQQLPITLHVGDLNMDGYPDVLTVMSRKHGDEDIQEAVLMFNEECHGCEAGRTLVPRWDTQLQSLSGVILATFFDIHENGVLDILTVSLTKDGQVPAVRAYRNDFDADTCFVKITVVSGLCDTNCLDGREPYGVNQPGPTIAYKTQYTLGVYQKSSVSQLSQTAHFAAQLPYTIFGLGQTPNFVDQLTVGIPTPKDSNDIRKKTWTQIIPNSQLIVIPHPNDNPDKWTLKLFLMPSKLIYITGFSLLGTCAICGVIVGVLHLLEKQEDKVEKQQESQKFHFDAM